MRKILLNGVIVGEFTLYIFGGKMLLAYFFAKKNTPKGVFFLFWDEVLFENFYL